MAHWQGIFETVQHSDKLAADVGVFCLKILLTVNAGGIIALLALVANKENDTVLYAAAIIASRWFLAGLISAMLSMGFAYFYQSFVTLIRRRELDVASASVKKPRYDWAGKWTSILYWPMVGFATVAFGLFIVGSIVFLSSVT